MRVSGLFLYPVKSLRGIAVDAATLTNGRFLGDREFLVVDRDGEFMDMRRYPQMARVDAVHVPGGLQLRSEGFPDCVVITPSVPRAERVVQHVFLWRRSAPVTSTSDDADRWLSDVLGVPCRLMAFVPDVAALTVPSYEVHSSLQDATPFHITSEESLADLNARAGTSLPMNRFRPNIVVRGSDAYAEDGWKTVAIGDTRMQWIKSCTRCVATTTDQLTGERMGREPLFTLSKYRREGPNVVFGHYFAPESWGSEIRVGDELRVIEGRGM